MRERITYQEYLELPLEEKRYWGQLSFQQGYVRDNERRIFMSELNTEKFWKELLSEISVARPSMNK